MTEFISFLRYSENSPYDTTMTIKNCDTMIEAIMQTVESMPVNILRDIVEIRSVRIDDMTQVGTKRIVENVFKFTRESLKALHESS